MEEPEHWTRTYLLEVPTEKQSVKAEGKTGVYERDCMTSPSADFLVIHPDPEMELGMCEWVNGLGSLMVAYSARIMIRSQYAKHNFLNQNRNF